MAHNRSNFKMLIEELVNDLKQIPKTYFSINDIRKFYKGEMKSLPVIISRLEKKGILKKIIKGYYTFDLNLLDYEDFACTYKRPSYISLEYALYHHGLIDQLPETITLITSGKSQTINTNEKILEYSHIKRDLFFGYEIVGNMLMATKEKAILDELYLIALKKRTLNINKLRFIFQSFMKSYKCCIISIILLRLVLQLS